MNNILFVLSIVVLLASMAGDIVSTQAALSTGKAHEDSSIPAALMEKFGALPGLLILKGLFVAVGVAVYLGSHGNLFTCAIINTVMAIPGVYWTYQNIQVYKEATK